MASTGGDISQLTAMGFTEEKSRAALRAADGNVEAAVNYLLGAVDATASVAAAPAEAPPTILTESMEQIAGGILTCPISQYSVNNGRSACTCIALTAATDFLKNPKVNSEFLENMIHQGVRNYEALSSASSVEHLSAEEVLQKDQGRLFPLRSLEGGIRQGVLSNDRDHPLGLKSILEGIRQEETKEWIVVLITKTPETVLVCLPPDSLSPSSYWLIDSHPRSHLGAESAYAKHHTALSSLVLSLETLFPSTQLGPDIPEMMAMMYNSFDMYPLKMC
eukprot:scaffold3618_cov129-Cylindrotheca_fusiformis.AAC.23